MNKLLMLWRRTDVYVKSYLTIVAALLLMAMAYCLAGCTYNVTLTVSLPGDSTPTVVEPQPQTKPDMNL